MTSKRAKEPTTLRTNKTLKLLLSENWTPASFHRIAYVAKALLGESSEQGFVDLVTVDRPYHRKRTSIMVDYVGEGKALGLKFIIFKTKTGFNLRVKSATRTVLKYQTTAWW